MNEVLQGIPADGEYNPNQIDMSNFERMEDMDEDSRLAAQLQAEEMMKSMNMGEEQQRQFELEAQYGAQPDNSAENESLRRYERRMLEEYKKNKKRGINSDIKREREDGDKSPTLGEKFLNFIGCGAKKSKPDRNQQ